MSDVCGPEVGSEFARQFIGARQGFHEYVVKNKGSDPNIVDPDQEIVDINVSGIHRPVEFESFAEIEHEYDKLRDNIPDDEQDRDTLEQKIEADQMMLGVLQGREVDFDSFVLATMGFVPREISSDTIDPLIGTLDEQLQQLGIRYDAGSLPDYDKQLILSDPSDIQRAFSLGLRMSRNAISRYIKPLDKQPDPEYINDPSIPWSGFMTTDEQGNFSLTANIHPSKRYTAGKIGTWMLHEDGGHVVQMAIWEEAIKRGDMSPAMGLTSVTSPETTQAEAVASFSETLLPEVTPDDKEKLLADIAVNYDTLYTAVTHNAHIRINSGVPEDKVVAETVEKLPFERQGRIRIDVQAVRDLPTYRAGFACYGFVRELIQPVIDIKDVEKRRKAIVPLYKKPLTIEQMKEVIAASC